MKLNGTLDFSPATSAPAIVKGGLWFDGITNSYRGSTDGLTWGTLFLVGGSFVINALELIPQGSPPTPIRGKIYFDDTDDKFYGSNDGSTWVEFNLGSALGDPVDIIHGGTGAADSLTALSNLGAAASGSNSDITELTGLTTALDVVQGGTGASTLTDHGVLLGSGVGEITALGVAGDGQIPIGSTGADPVLANITPGAGVTITNGPGSVEISVSGGVVSLDSLNLMSAGILNPTGSTTQSVYNCAVADSDYLYITASSGGVNVLTRVDKLTGAKSYLTFGAATEISQMFFQGGDLWVSQKGSGTGAGLGGDPSRVTQINTTTFTVTATHEGTKGGSAGQASINALCGLFVDTSDIWVAGEADNSGNGGWTVDKFPRGSGATTRTTLASSGPKSTRATKILPDPDGLNLWVVANIVPSPAIDILKIRKSDNALLSTTSYSSSYSASNAVMVGTKIWMPVGWDALPNKGNISTGPIIFTTGMLVFDTVGLTFTLYPFNIGGITNTSFIRNVVTDGVYLYAVLSLADSASIPFGSYVIRFKISDQSYQVMWVPFHTPSPGSTDSGTYPLSATQGDKLVLDSDNGIILVANPNNTNSNFTWIKLPSNIWN